MQVEPGKGQNVLTNATGQAGQEVLPLIDVPKLTADQRDQLIELFDKLSKFDSKAVIRGSTGRAGRR